MTSLSAFLPVSASSWSRGSPDATFKPSLVRSECSVRPLEDNRSGAAAPLGRRLDDPAPDTISRGAICVHYGDGRESTELPFRIRDEGWGEADLDHPHAQVVWYVTAGELAIRQ